MLNSKDFDLWADGYDRSVGVSDDEGTYPFAGYKAVLNEIYNRVLNAPARKVLDIGFGTGVLTAKLYEQGMEIYGQDFSDRMIELAQVKMPAAQLFQGDFAYGLVEPLMKQKYDAIIATYSLHHLTDSQKVVFINSLIQLLNEDGCIYIGDVAFESCAALQKCKNEVGDEWDDEEEYFVFDELKLQFPSAEFEPMSCCAGIITLKK